MSEHDKEVTQAIADTAEVLNDQITKVEIGEGEDRRVVEILKCKVRQIGLVLTFLSQLFEKLGVNKLGQVASQDLENPTVLLNLVAESSDDVFAVATSLCSLEREEFDELDVDDALKVMLAIWEVNQSFFSERVLPLLVQSGLAGTLVGQEAQETLDETQPEDS